MDAAEFRRRRDNEGTDSLVRGRAASPPERCALRHGVYAKTGVLACKRCPARTSCEAFDGEKGALCALEAEFIPARQAQIAEVVADAELMWPSVVECVYAEVRLWRARRAVEATGEFRVTDDGGELRPTKIADSIPRLQKAVVGMWKELGLTPRAQQELQRSRPSLHPLAAAILQVDREDREAREKTIDAEFTPQPDQEADTDEH